MPVSFRLAAFYFAFFAWVGLVTAYFPPYLAARGLDPAQIAWVLALPPLARIVAPPAWGGPGRRGRRHAAHAARSPADPGPTCAARHARDGAASERVLRGGIARHAVHLPDAASPASGLQRHADWFPVDARRAGRDRG